jgi:hypothetical protein
MPRCLKIGLSMKAYDSSSSASTFCRRTRGIGVARGADAGAAAARDGLLLFITGAVAVAMTTLTFWLFRLFTSSSPQQAGSFGLGLLTSTSIQSPP